MKRYAMVAVLLCVVLAGAAFVYAAESGSSSRLTISPSDMKDGESKTLVDGDNTITVKRNGDALDLTIAGAGKTRHVTIVRGGDGEIRVERSGKSHDGAHTWVVGPDRPRILIDGMDFGNPAMRLLPRHAGSQTWFVCPKDHSMLRVPEDKKDGTFKCPVDGTTMEQRKGRGFAYFFDDQEFHADDM
jgi:hemin uptake protein HemP